MNGAGRIAAALCAAGALVAGSVATASAAPATFLGGLNTIRVVSSTVPPNGDVNPYGVVVVGQDNGRLHRGSVLVSNFNNKANLQGTGSTIVQIDPHGKLSVFARIRAHGLPGPCPGGIGLTTALSVLSSGWVVVGSLPTSDGTSATAQAGCLLVLDSSGRVRETIAGGPINGPWDMTAVQAGDDARLFVTNVLNGTVSANGAVVNRGTVVRISLRVYPDRPPRVERTVVVGSGFAERTDPAALVVGPTGVAFDPANGRLFVADTASNRISAIPNALFRRHTAFTGLDVTSGGNLNGPLGMALAPNGDIVTVNGGDGLAVETTPAGAQVATRVLDSSGSPPGAGALFGTAIQGPHGLYFVDDATNTLNLLS